MQASRALLLLAVAAGMLGLVMAADTDAAPEISLGEAEVAAASGFNAMYFGILVSFAIFWTVYFFLYFFEYGSGGDYYFWLSSYGTLVFLIALGLSKYFTPAILAAVLAMTIVFIPITSAGFAAMMSVSCPDRFEGDKNSYGRTRLEQGM